jgi:hypothetical protein
MSTDRTTEVPRGNKSPHSNIFNSLLAVKATPSKYKNVNKSKQTTISFVGLGHKQPKPQAVVDIMLGGSKEEIREGWKLHIQAGCQNLLLLEGNDMQKCFSDLGEAPGPRATTAEKNKRILEEMYHNAATKFVLNMTKLSEFDLVTMSTDAPPLTSDGNTFRIAVRVCSVAVEVLNEIPMINVDLALLQRKFVACLSTQRRNNTRAM